MALNVQWRWSMPAVADPDRVAAGNRQDFLSGLDSIAAGLQKRGENQREQDQRQLANMMQNRQFWEQKRMNDQNLANQQFQLQKAQEQQEWMNKFYDKFFGSDPEWDEMKRLEAELSGGNSGINDASLIMMGLNPYLK